MTSGAFHATEISSIIVNREDRQRRTPTDISVLADSIRRLGLIHPIVITRDSVLVAGERRLLACAALGHTHINAQFTDEVEPKILRALELEENVKRSNLPWQEEATAIYEYHQLRALQEPKWSLEETGAELGMSRATVFNAMTVGQEITKGNEKVKNASGYSAAIGLVARAEARKQDALLEELKGPVKTEPRESPILCADFNEWVSTYSGPKFNFIHCDFPYGIDADKRQQGTSVEMHGSYEDDEETYWTLVSSLLRNLDRLCADSCHFMFWFSMRFYDSTHRTFAMRGVNLDWFPLVWTKSDNIGLLPDSARGPRRIYETCFFGSRGDRKIVRPKSNAFVGPTDRGFHMSVKPEPMLRHFMEMFVDENTVFLDPTCGSGSSVRAASALGARSVTGLEKDPEFAKLAQAAFRRSEEE